MILYNPYDTHTILYNSRILTIRRHNTEFFIHDMIRIAYHIILTTMIVGIVKAQSQTTCQQPTAHP